MLFLHPASLNAQDILYAQDQGKAAEAKAVIRGRWSDPNRSPDLRAEAALAAMTHQEKIALLNGTQSACPVSEFLRSRKRMRA